jgi:hypothetical protein
MKRERRVFAQVRNAERHNVEFQNVERHNVEFQNVERHNVEFQNVDLKMYVELLPNLTEPNLLGYHLTPAVGGCQEGASHEFDTNTIFSTTIPIFSTSTANFTTFSAILRRF